MYLLACAVAMKKSSARSSEENSRFLWGVLTRGKALRYDKMALGRCSSAVEQRFRKPLAVGSIPTTGSRFVPHCSSLPASCLFSCLAAMGPEWGWSAPSKAATACC